MAFLRSHFHMLWAVIVDGERTVISPMPVQAGSRLTTAAKADDQHPTHQRTLSNAMAQRASAMDRIHQRTTTLVSFQPASSRW